MDSNLVFVDTSMFYALINENDQFHKQAIQIWKKQKGQKVKLLTSNYILDEAFTLIRQRRGKRVLDEFRKSLLKIYEVKIIRVTVADEAGAWDFILNDWADLSFTDCVSFAMMKRLEIKKALSFDEHFKRAGFELVN